MLIPATSGAQGGPPGRGADACALVTKAEIEQALGVKLGDATKNPRMQNPGVLSSCDYSSPAGGQVSVLIRRTTAKYVIGSEKAEFEKQGMKLRYTQGLGTTAFFIDMSIGGNPTETTAGLETIARLVLERWKQRRTPSTA